MNRRDVSILVVEDDASQGKAIFEALERAGYSATLTNSGPKGLQLSRNQEFHCVILDCMLPKMNGVDLGIEIVKQSPQPPKMFLMSGIFKDKTFIKSSLDKTGAVAFFAKPMDLSALLDEVERAVPAGRGETDINDGGLVRLYTEAALDTESVLALVAAYPTLASFHLPMLYKRLQAVDVTGELVVTSETEAQNVIGFQRGQICSVRTPDKETYFGALAVGLGFVGPEEVLQALSGPPGKLLGQRLIDSMLLSPHAIGLILEEQLALRLSQTVQPGLVRVEWTPKRLTSPEYRLDPNRFVGLLGDWTRSKIKAENLKGQMALWGNHVLQGHYHPDVNDAHTLNDLLSHAEFVESVDLIYLYRQLIEGNASLGERGQETRNYSFLEHRLSQLLKDYESQNYYQILGVNEKAHTLELNKAMDELRTHFDPQTLASDVPKAIRSKAAKVWEQIQLAHQTLSNENARSKYSTTLQKKRSQEYVEHEPLFRSAVHALQTNHPGEALPILAEILAKNIQFKDLRALYLWAGIKVEKKGFKALTLDQIPPEERHSAPYHIAKGLWHRQSGQVTKAIECFRTALVLEPRLTIARSELERVRGEYETKNSSHLVADVTSVMKDFLGARKRGA